ncbi:MAG: glycosyltransferase [Acidimicrobiales bacterium]
MSLSPRQPRRASSAAPTSGDPTRARCRVTVEPGFEVVNVPAGPADLPKEQLESYVEHYADWVANDIVDFDPQLIHANYWLSGVAGQILKRRLNIPLVTTFHTLARVKAESGDAEPERRALAEASVMHCADSVLANCDAEADQLAEYYDASPDRIEIVPPGVDHAFFSPGNQAGARWALNTDERPLLLFVGRIQPLKGVDVAVQALAKVQHPDARLWIVGGASGAGGKAEVERVEKLIADLGLVDRVEFIPPQPHHLLSTYYRAADICLVPSRSESFGLVALEAAACGTPVVASAVGGLLTLVEHGHTGYLVENRDPDEYAAWIDAILGDPVLARRLSVSAAARARGYTWSTSAARLRRLYADLTAKALAPCE